MLTIKNLTKAMGGRTLFREANLTVNWGERVALVGPNGAGKSTLFKIVLDEETMDEGTVDRDEYAITGFLAQEAGEPTDETIIEIAMGIDDEMVNILRTIREGEASGKLDTPEFAKAQDRYTELNGYALEPKAKKILAGLGFKQDEFEKAANQFSGGWVMRAHIARLLVMEPDLLMMDEPTNHLDLMSLLWFQRYLSNYPGAILMISHDRDFMDGLVEQVVEIDPDAMELISYTGNYSSYQEQRQKRYDQKVQAWRNHKKEMDRVQEFIDRFRNVGSKSSQVQDRIRQLDKMKEKMQKPRAPR